MIFITTKGGGVLTHSLSRKDKLTEADIAYEVLKTQGYPMHYQILIEEVFQRLEISLEAIRIAAALTQINLDTRFSFLGRGEWGLKAWESTKVPKRPNISLMNKVASDEEDKSDLEELDEDALDEDGAEASEVFDETDEGQRGEKW